MIIHVLTNRDSKTIQTPVFLAKATQLKNLISFARSHEATNSNHAIICRLTITKK